MLLHLLPTNVAVFSFEVQRLASVAGRGNANQPNGITVFVRVGACHAGNSHRHIGGRTMKRAFGHRHGYIPTHRPLGVQESGIDAKRFNLVRLRVGDEASMQMLSGARGLGQERRKLAGRAGLSRHDREISPDCRCKGAFREVCKVESVSQHRALPPGSIVAKTSLARTPMHNAGGSRPVAARGTGFQARRFPDVKRPRERTRVMGLFTKDVETMDDLLLHGLKDIYYAENQIVKSLPKLIEKATNRDLNKGLKDHLEETKNQIGRLDQVFKKLGQEPQGVKCPAIDGLISEADEVAGEVADKDVLDAAIVGSAQAVEHYEIARYGTLIAWAESLGHDDIIRLLNTNLNEEKAADKKLSTVAVRKGVNRKAAS